MAAYLSRSWRSLVRYQVEHSMRNSISTRTHVLSSISHNMLEPTLKGHHVLSGHQ